MTALATAGALLLSLLVVALQTTSASAHGAAMKPGSRTFLCWRDGLSPQGNIVPHNPACAAAVDHSGDNSLYNWFGVLRSDGAGRTRGFIPDGQLCSGGNPGYAGFDLPSGNWPLTHLTSGASFDFSYNAWAAHPGWFYLYVTKDGFDPSKPLTWDALENEPFLSVDHPPLSGQVGTVDGRYTWTGALPAGKTGRHLIYSVWQRSDSAETFYGCSDVVFDGGSGEVTGVGPQPTPTSSPTTTPTTPPDPSSCMAVYTVTNSWPGGYQATVTVMNHSASAYNGWTTRWTVPSGQTITNVWNGTFTQSGSAATVRHADWNRVVPADGTTTFGLVATSTGTNPAVPMATCQSP
jgi:predicted carbohydrate-binding protein with CBM5 and CBM33 domain